MLAWYLRLPLYIFCRSRSMPFTLHTLFPCFPHKSSINRFFMQHNHCFILFFFKFLKTSFLILLSFFFFSLVDRFSLDAFANAAFNYKVNSLDDPDATLFRYMMVFNHSSSADNPIAGLASKSCLLMMENKTD